MCGVRLRNWYFAASCECPGTPLAKVVICNSQWALFQVTTGIGRYPSTRDCRISTSAHETIRRCIPCPSITNGSIDTSPGANSMAPSSPISALVRPPSIPTTVQYACSPEKLRGYWPRAASLAMASKKAFGDFPNAMSFSSTSDNA